MNKKNHLDVMYIDLWFKMKEIIQELSKGKLEDILSELLLSYITPAFGTLPKSEIDLLVLGSMIKCKYISNEPNTYELVSKLKVTNTKAKKLIYERELRRYDLAQLDEKVKEVLSNPLIQKEGTLFLFDVDNPLLIDHIKNKLKILGHLSDSSFSLSIIKLSSSAIIDLIDEYIKDGKEEIEIKLSHAGIEQTTVKGFLSSFVVKLGRKFADDTGEEAIQSIKEYLKPLFQEINDEYLSKIKGLLND